MWQRLRNSKTLYVALGVILCSLGAAFQGVTDWESAIQTMIGGLLAILVRDGVAKGPS